MTDEDEVRAAPGGSRSPDRKILRHLETITQDGKTGEFAKKAHR